MRKWLRNILIGFACLTGYAALALSGGPHYDEDGSSYLSSASPNVVSGDMTIPAASAYVFSGRSKIASSQDGYMVLTNNAGTDFSRLYYGPTGGSHYPYWVVGTAPNGQAQLTLNDTTSGNGAFVAQAYRAAAGAYGFIMTGTGSITLSSAGQLQWTASGSTGDTTDDTGISRSAAGSVAVVAVTKGQTTAITHSTQSLTFAANPGNASKTTSGLVPDGAFLLGITTRVTTTATNCTSVSIGDGTDVDMFGATTGITQNTTTTNADATAQFGRSPATAAMEVTITANGGNCFTGVWAVTAHYILPTAATSN